MIPVEPTSEQVARLAEGSIIPPELHVIGGPDEAPDVIPCPTLITAHRDQEGRGEVEFHVAYRLDEIELAHLARGGTLWMTTWGHLPIHRLSVEEP